MLITDNGQMTYRQTLSFKVQNIQMEGSARESKPSAKLGNQSAPGSREVEDLEVLDSDSASPSALGSVSRRLSRHCATAVPLGVLFLPLLFSGFTCHVSTFYSLRQAAWHNEG